MRQKTFESLTAVPACVVLVLVLLLGCATSAWAQSLAATISTGAGPEAVAVNKTTHMTYVANYGGSVTIIDGTTRSTLAVNAGLHPYAVAVNEATNKIYVADEGANPLVGSDRGSVIVIDGATNSPTTVVDPHARGPRAIAVNSVTNKIYVANAWTGNVTVIDGATNSTFTITDPNASGLQAVAVAINPVTNVIYVVNSQPGSSSTAGNVTVIDGVTNFTTTITDPNAFAPVAVAVNSATNKTYIANQGNYPGSNHGGVTVIDGDTHSVTTVTDPRALAPQNVAVNQTTNKIYVVNASDPELSGIGGVSVIDGATNAVIAVRDPNASFPHAVSVDPVTDRAYIANEGCFFPDACKNPGSVTVIDLATNSTTTIINPQARNPEAVAVDPTTNLVYVANVGSGNLTLIDEAQTPTTHTLAVLEVGSGTGTVTSNPSGINCGTTCVETVAAGTALSLSAQASSGSTFAGWSGPCTGTGSCDLVLNADHFVTATFDTPSAGVAVPNVIGLTQAAATTAITGAGLVPGTVTLQSSSTVASGEVISESPAAGTDVASGAAIDLVVSNGASSGGGTGAGSGGGGGGGVELITLGVLLASLSAARRTNASAHLREAGTGQMPRRSPEERSGAPECR